MEFGKKGWGFLQWSYSGYLFVDHARARSDTRRPVCWKPPSAAGTAQPLFALSHSGVFTGYFCPENLHCFDKSYFVFTASTT